jgi:DNA polymerase-1
VLWGVDSETWPIVPGNLTPKMVCGQFATKGSDARILLREEALDELHSLLSYPGDTLVFHNGPFDLAVAANERPSLLPLIFEALEHDRIKDTEVREKLLNIADGTLKFDEDEEGNAVKVSYSLGETFCRYFPERVADPDIVGWLEEKDSPGSWRLRYCELEGIPPTAWPDRARTYAALDPVNTLGLYLAQQQRAKGPVVNEDEQTRAAWALHLISVRGMITDGPYVAQMRETLDKEYSRLQRYLIDAGLIEAPRPKKSGKNKGELTEPKRKIKLLRRYVSKYYVHKGLPVPYVYDKKKREYTDNVSYARKILEATDSPTLKAMAGLTSVEKGRNTYLPVLESGVSARINFGYNSILTTGRTSCRGVIQTFPRKGGFREAFWDGPDRMMIGADYAAIELRALAEVCLVKVGRSKMAEAFNAGVDPHYQMAAKMLGISYEEAVARGAADDETVLDARQKSKALNFGLPGMLGAAAFVDYARDSYGVLISLEEAEARIQEWLDMWEEMPEYFRWIKSTVRRSGKRIEQLYSGRVRGGLTLPQAANTTFQGLASDGKKYALELLTKASWLDDFSPFYGAHLLAEIHDEMLASAEIAKASDAVKELSRLMVLGMSKYIRHVKVETSMWVATHWYKKAKAVFDAEGNVLPWRPDDERARLDDAGARAATRHDVGPEEGVNRDIEGLRADTRAA